MSLNKFIAGVKKGIANTSHFAVNIKVPKVLGKSGMTRDLQSILMFCDATVLPGFTYHTIEHKIFGESRQMPYHKMYESVSLSFYVDHDMKVKQFFDLWLEGIYGTQSRLYEYYNTYTTTIDLMIYDLKDNMTYYVRLEEAYPKAIASIQLGYASTEVMKLQVQMEYKYYTVSKGSKNKNMKMDSIGSYLSSFLGFQSSGEGLNILESMGSAVGTGTSDLRTYSVPSQSRGTGRTFEQMTNYYS